MEFAKTVELPGIFVDNCTVWKPM